MYILYLHTSSMYLCTYHVSICLSVFISVSLPTDFSLCRLLLRIYRLGGLKNKHLFLTVVKAKSKIKKDLIYNGFLFLLCRQPSSCCVLTWQREKAPLSLSLFLNSTNPIIAAPPSWSLLNTIGSQRPHLQISSHLEVRAPTSGFLGGICKISD